MGRVQKHLFKPGQKCEQPAIYEEYSPWTGKTGKLVKVIKKFPPSRGPTVGYQISRKLKG